MPEPPGQIRFRRTCSLHTHQVHIPSITFFFSLTPFDPFFLPPSLPLTLHLSLSFTLCYLPFLLSVSYLCFLICVISLAYFSSSPPLLPYFHDIPNHSVPFNSITCYSTLIPILFYSIPFQFIPFYSRDLSGGQKARVVFVELSLMAPHLLFLDVRHPSSHPYLLSLFQFSHCSCFTTVHFTRIQSLTGPC